MLSSMSQLKAGPGKSSQTRLVVTGTGDGGIATLALLPDALVRGDGRIDEVILADPSETNLRAGLLLAGKRGLSATGYVCHAEVAVADGLGTPAPVILQTDQLPPLVHILTAPEATVRAILAFLFLLLPNGRLLGLRLVYAAGTRQERRAAAGLFAALHRFTRRSPREAIFGVATRVAHRLAEPLYRRWFAEHVGTNVPKLVAGLPPVSEPIEGTFDGRHTLPIIPVFHTGTPWDDPALLDAALDASPEILPLDGDLILAEVTPDVVRLHVGRVRKATVTGRNGSPGRVWDPPITIDRKHLLFVTD